MQEQGLCKTQLFPFTDNNFLKDILCFQAKCEVLDQSDHTVFVSGEN